MILRPITLEDAKKIIGRWHRHNRPPLSGLFAVAAEADGQIVGVLTAGRPVARALQDGFSVELTRNCTNGHANACSFLYGAGRRAAVALGYRNVYTYTLQSESGSSLRAAGFVVDAVLPARATWSCKTRPRGCRLICLAMSGARRRQRSDGFGGLMSRSFKQHHTPKQQRTIYSRKEWLWMLRCLRETPWQPGEPLGCVARRLDVFIKVRGAEAIVAPDQRLWEVDMRTALKVIVALGQDVPRGRKPAKKRAVSQPRCSKCGKGLGSCCCFPRIAS